MERYLEGTRGIKEILDARISTLREADRPLDQGASTDGAPAPQSSAGGARAARVDVSPNVTWDPSDHALGPNGLPHFDGTTYARVVMGDTEYFIRSGAGEPGIEAWNDPNIKAGAVTPSHVEGHAAVILRRSEVSEATLFINHPEGPCRYCQRVTANIVPAGSSLTVIWPNGNYTYRGKG